MGYLSCALAGRGATVGCSALFGSISWQPPATRCLAVNSLACRTMNLRPPVGRSRGQQLARSQRRLGSIGNRFLMNREEREREINQPFLIWRPTEMKRPTEPSRTGLDWTDLNWTKPLWTGEPTRELNRTEIGKVEKQKRKRAAITRPRYTSLVSSLGQSRLAGSSHSSSPAPSSARH